MIGVIYYLPTIMGLAIFIVAFAALLIISVMVITFCLASAGVKLLRLDQPKQGNLDDE